MGHRKWTLIGKDFSLKYIECGDEYELMKGPNGKETVYNYFIIKAKKDILKEIKSILQTFTIFNLDESS